MMQKVIKDKNGVVINIGDWEYKFKKVATNLPPEGTIAAKDWDYRYETVAENPLPEGAYEDVAEVVVSADGGRYVANNYAALRRTEYPSVGDQLDALFKAGAFPPEMAEKLQAVKDQYKKPAP